jgi:hypothetical protein
MYFLVDPKNKISFGWSAKCGCTHVKYLFWYLLDIPDPKIHRPEENGDLPADIENYTTIIFVRDPYKRLKPDGRFRHLWKQPILTFSMFVEKLEQKCWDIIDKHHFFESTRIESIQML